MTFRHSFILLVVAAALGTYVTLYDPPFGTLATKNQTPQNQLIDVAAHQIQSVAIQRNGQALQLVRRGSNWAIESPIDYPAAATKVAAFLEQLTTARFQTSLPLASANEADLLIQYGLDQPEGTLSLSTDGKTVSLAVGRLSPGNLTFVRRNQEPQILAVSSDVLKAWDASSDRWRDPRVFPYPATDIEGIEIIGPLSKARLERAAETQSWHMREPRANARVDQEFVRWFLQQLSELRVAAFVESSDTPSQVRVQLTLGSGKTYALDFQSELPNNPGLVHATIGHSQTGITTQKVFSDSLRDPEKVFRSPYLVTPGYSFDTIEFRGDEQFTLEQDLTNGDWWITQPKRTNRVPADRRLVAQMMLQLAELRINEFVTDQMNKESDYGIDFPFRSIKLSRAQSEPEHPGLLLRFGFELRNHFLTHRSDETSIYAVPFGAVMQLPGKAYQFRTRRLWDINSETIARLGVKDQEERDMFWQKVDGQWQNPNQDSEEVESAALARLVDELVRVEVEGWTGQGDAIGTRYQLGSKGTLSLYPDGSEPIHLTFGSISPRGHRYAATRLDGMTTVFEFPGPLYVQLQRTLGLGSPTPNE